MSSRSFGAFIQHESLMGDNVAGPAQVLHRDEITSISPLAVELDELRWGERLNGPKAQRPFAPEAEDSSLQTPRELEQSLPSPPRQSKAVGAIVQSATNPPRNRWRLASTGVMFLLIGINDAVVR